MALDFTALRASVTSINNALTSKISGRVTPAVLESEISKSVPAGALGQIPFIDVDGTRQSAIDNLLHTGAFVNTPAELADAQNSVVDNETIFNTWSRYSHVPNSEDQPAIVADTTSWTYDGQTDILTNTVNTVSSVGVVSSSTHVNYELEARIRSSDADDDTIGIVLAWYVDPNTGREYNICAVRSPGGSGFTWKVSYNFNRSDMFNISNKSNTIRWGNGGSGSTLAAAGYVTNQAVGGWDDFYPAGTKIKAIREGDVFNIITTEFQNPEVYVESSRIIFDLTSNPLLEKFRGPRPYGYMALSQAMAEWQVISMNDPFSHIYDLSNGNVWVFNQITKTWVQDSTKTLQNTLGLGRLMYNPTTKKMFFTDTNGDPKLIDISP